MDFSIQYSADPNTPKDIPNLALFKQENGPRKSRESLANEKQQLDNDLQTTEQSLSDVLSKIEVLKSTNAMHEEMFRNSKTKWEQKSSYYKDSTRMALGCLCIVAGILFLIDFLFSVKNTRVTVVTTRRTVI